MAGITIGNNVVIGAGSIVNRDIPDNVVVAGTPAKVIKTLEEYKKKCIEKGCQILTNDVKLKRKQIELILNKL